jgi:hypothetical protein
MLALPRPRRRLREELYGAQQERRWTGTYGPAPAGPEAQRRERPAPEHNRPARLARPGTRRRPMAALALTRLHRLRPRGSAQTTPVLACATSHARLHRGGERLPLAVPHVPADVPVHVRRDVRAHLPCNVRGDMPGDVRHVPGDDSTYLWEGLSRAHGLEVRDGCARLHVPVRHAERRLRPAALKRVASCRAARLTLT